MLEKIIIGIIIGFFSGLFFPTKSANEDKKSEVILLVIMIVSIGFIASSFNYGALYGIMAIGEITIGFSISSGIKKSLEKN